MRTLNRSGRFLGSFLIASLLTLSSIFAQEKEVDFRTFLDQATEEVPDKNTVQPTTNQQQARREIASNLGDLTEKHSSQLSKSETAKQQTFVQKDDTRSVLQNATEDVPAQAKPRFVRLKSYSDKNLKIQLGYFKEKKNVSKMVNKIKNKYDWSVYVKTENKNGTDFYRVMIVDISSKRSATTIMNQLKSEGLKGFIK